MEWCYFKIILQIRAGRAQRRTPAQRSRLAALPTEEAQVEMVFITDLVIDFSHAVVAVACGRDRAEEIVIGRSQTPNQPPGPKAVRTNEILRERTRCHRSVGTILA